ncbi:MULTISPECIES: carbohydrate ABC transporter permease [unclassified Rathayibacter]|uniref:carbohydrate ABC transporter permease n=1 Tax=unclassified Rathayibacter TaxID=2609250 RepID=UPI0006F5C4E6|nr:MULTISPECIES: carbohydrate ABC transporter permease [unclassified Rathayibacter]KQQ05455.1 ABC transporter permease [Rathayibacter sp. Leaf294]KQS13318.1 ABC transporter permease [Rathayibacter sp. Leaf185]
MSDRTLSVAAAPRRRTVTRSAGEKARSEAMSLSAINRRRRRTDIVSQVLLTVFVLLFMVPLIWMVSTSLKPGAEVFASPPSLLGSEIRWQNYADVWSYVPFGTYMLNGAIVSVLGTLLVVVTSVLSAYAFSRLRFRGRDGIFFVFLGTLMVPQEVVVIPMFLFMTQLGWIDSYQALIVPWAFTAFGSFLLRQAMLSVPMELEEAGKLDGASHLRILLGIIVPVVKPTIAVLVVFTFINYWNSFLWPLIAINDPSYATVPLGLNSFLGQGGKQWQLIMAASTISMIPTAGLAILLQRYLVKGIALSSGLGGK